MSIAAQRAFAHTLHLIRVFPGAHQDWYPDAAYVAKRFGCPVPQPEDDWLAQAAAPEVSAKVLIIHPDPAVTDQVVQVATLLGATTRVCRTYAEGRLAMEDRPDMVVIGLVLPDADGRTVLFQLRTARATASVPCLVLHGGAGQVPLTECRALWGRSVRTPVSPVILGAAIARGLVGLVGDPQFGLPALRGLLVDLQELASARLSGPWVAGLVRAHPEGDDLQTLARTLRGQLPGRLARWDADTLAVLLPGEDAQSAQLRLHSLLGERVMVGAVEGRSADAQWVFAAAARVLLLVAQVGGGVVVAPPAEAERYRVLVADDDPTTHILVASALKGDGVEVESVVDGASALQRVRDGDFAAVILDIQMPQMDGFEVLQAVRTLPHGERLPVMVLTSQGNEDDTIRGFKLGADDYITKPVAPRLLRARLEALIARRR